MQINNNEKKYLDTTGRGFNVYNDLIRLVSNAITNKEQIDLLK